jgi:hypothetical protein
MTLRPEDRADPIGLAYSRYATGLFRYAVICPAIERALRALPAEQREVVHLKIHEG